MMAVTAQDNIFSQRALTNLPIFRRSLVNHTSGITAKNGGKGGYFVKPIGIFDIFTSP